MKNYHIKSQSIATLFAFFILHSSFFILSSCSDMMETDSDRQSIEPELNAKTDSVFYAFGIAQAMQQLADQYFFQGEMRGELVTTTDKTDINLRQLANFSADITNKYDSAYVYYRVINNCNYYLAHRDTTLLTGSTDVTRREYAAVKAYRAWAYLQLARNYGKVPFFTEPLTTISQIDDNKFPEYGIEEIAANLCPDLETYSGTSVPNYGTSISCGFTNFGLSKTMDTRKCFIPVNVILGDLYLETGQYQKAINSYVTYLTTEEVRSPSVIAPFKLRNKEDQNPTNMRGVIASSPNYGDIYNNNNVTDIVTYIPMSVSRVRGTTTNVPNIFGYDYYALTTAACWKEDIQLLPSEAYNTLTEDLAYYYYENVLGGTPNRDVTSGPYGDMRSLAIMHTRQQASNLQTDDEEDLLWIDKFQSGNIILYRISTIYLHLCEALNRAGLPDAAFAFLKEGINSNDTIQANTWLSEAGKQFFRTTFLNEKNGEIFYNNSQPIHQRGCGVTSDRQYPGAQGASPYQFATEIGNKLKKLAENAALYPGLASRVTANATTKADTIMAMEELLCDEEALEFCFEGSRWYDLMRFAKHKNRAGLQGNAWLADKLKANAPTKALTDEQNWYLPFKK